MLSEQRGLGKAGGRLPGAGELLRQLSLACTYKPLVCKEHDAFYCGPLTYSMTKYVQQYGGVLSMQDMAEHRPQRVSPLSTSDWESYDIYELLPCTQGTVTLKLIEGYDLQSLGYHTSQHLHVLLEGDVQPLIHVQLLSVMIDFPRNAQQAASASLWLSAWLVVVFVDRV